VGVNKTSDKDSQRYYWLQARNNVEKWCQHCDACATKCNLQIKGQGLMHQYDVGAPYERITIGIVGSFSQSNQGN
jgi:ferredoxin